MLTVHFLIDNPLSFYEIIRFIHCVGKTVWLHVAMATQ